MTHPIARQPDPSRPLVEREGELAVLDELLSDAEGGTGRTLAIRGIGGIGKSTLLDAAVDRARGRGWLVLRARADEPEQDFSFGVAVQLFEAALAELPGDQRDAVFDGPAGLARPLLASHGHRLPDESALFSTLHGLYWLTVNLADLAPVLLVVDDAHWSDAASLRFLQYLARRVEDHQIVVLVGTRPTVDGPNASLLESLARHGLVQPAPLSAQGLARVLEAAHPDLDDLEVERWHGLTGGVPLYVQELLRSGGPAEAHEAGLDRSLATVRVRLASLSAPARTFVESAAVAGDTAPWWQVVRLSEVDDPAGSIRRELVDAALLLDTSTIRFVHPAIRESIEATLPPAVRERMHARTALLHDESGAPAELVAHHLLLSAPGRSDHHAEILRLAASRARAGGSPALGVTWLRRALEEQPSASLRAELLGDLAMTAASAGEEWSAALGAHLALVDDPVRRGEARLRVGRALTQRGLLDDATIVFEQALGERDDADRADAITLDLLAGLAIASRIDASGRVRIDDLIERALAGAEVGTGRQTRALSSFLAYDRSLTTGPAGDVRRIARAAILHPEVTDDEVLRSATYYPAVLALHFADDADGVEEATARGLDVAERRANELLFGLMSNGRGILRMAQGRASEALDDLGAAAEVMRRNRSVTLPGAAGNLALCLAIRDQLADAHEALELPGGLGDWEGSSSYTYWLFARGVVRIAAADPAGVDDLRSVLARQRSLGATNPATIPASFALAEALASIDPAEARTIFAEARDLAAAFGAPRTLAAASRVQAKLEPADALDHLRRAEALVAEGPWGLERMRVRLDLGAALLDARATVESREPLRLVLAEADASGAIALSAAARAALVAGGARPRRAALVGPAALTPTERQVAQMAADGLTNRQIAARRFVSVKAVEYQLANAYRKLHITARAQLPSALHPEDVAR